MTFFRIAFIIMLCSWMAGYAFADEAPPAAPSFIPLHASGPNANVVRAGGPARFIALPPRTGGIPLARMTRPQPQAALLMPPSRPLRKRETAAADLPQGTPVQHELTKDQAHQIVSIFAAAD